MSLIRRILRPACAGLLVAAVPENGGEAPAGPGRVRLEGRTAL